MENNNLPQTKAGRPKGVPFFSRVKAKEMADLINQYSPDKVHPVEIIFKAFCQALTSDEKSHLLALLRAEMYPSELTDDSQPNLASVAKV